MRFRVDEISSVIAEEIQQYRQEVDLAETGKVLEVGDGIARVYGLSNAMAGELISFSNGETTNSTPGLVPKVSTVVPGSVAVTLRTTNGSPTKMSVPSGASCSSPSSLTMAWPFAT